MRARELPDRARGARHRARRVAAGECDCVAQGGQRLAPAHPRRPCLPAGRASRHGRGLDTLLRHGRDGRGLSPSLRDRPCLRPHGGHAAGERGPRRRMRHGAHRRNATPLQAADDRRGEVGRAHAHGLRRERRQHQRLGRIPAHGSPLPPVRLHGRGVHSPEAGDDCQRGVPAHGRRGRLCAQGDRPRSRRPGQGSRRVPVRRQDDRRAGCAASAASRRPARQGGRTRTPRTRLPE